MQLLRKNVSANSIISFEFDLSCTKFLVKNLTKNNIYACIGDIYIEENAALILPNISEQLCINQELENPTTTVMIFCEGTGEIEVQALTYTTLFTDILNNLKIIAKGIYGKDIRKAIHDSIQIINNKANKIENLLKKLIRNETSNNPSASEVVQARGDFELLDDRLNDIDGKISSLRDSLSDKAPQTDLNNIKTEVENLKIISLIKDNEIKTYTVNEEENTFALPDNYQENSIVKVFVNSELVTLYSISEIKLVKCVVLDTSIENSIVKIICMNFEESFEEYIKKLIQNNTPVG